KLRPCFRVSVSFCAVRCSDRRIKPSWRREWLCRRRCETRHEPRAQETENVVPRPFGVFVSRCKSGVQRFKLSKMSITADDLFRSATADRKTKNPIPPAIKARLETLRTIKSAIADLKKALKQLMHECHRYEPDIPFRSNVAGDPIHLRMPATRSGCWT